MFDNMTLEDFFTLNEMKNGLTTLARVEELICVMQKQKDCATSNVSDAARQWAAVASTFASTENQDCLSHFVHLNGLCFLNQWLQEAMKCTQEATDASEWINALFGLLEKLPIDREKLNDSGILLTIEKLFSHKTADIKLRAQTLFARWNTERINDDCCQGNTERINEDCCQDMEEGCLNLVESSKPDATSVQYKHGDDKTADSSPCQTAVEEGSCRSESDRIEKLRARSPNSLNSNNTDDGLKPHQTMKMISSSEEKEKSASIPVPALDSSSFEGKLSVDETSVALMGMVSSSAPVSPKVLVKGDEECSTSATKNQTENDAEMNKWIGNSYDLGQRDGFCVSTGRSATSPKEKPISLCGASAILESKGAGNLSDDGDRLLRREVGEFDALEFARQVAFEVEREVVDYREQSCSFSTELSSGDIVNTAVTDITPKIGLPNGNGSNDYNIALSPKNDNCMISEVISDHKVKQSLQSPNRVANDEKDCFMTKKIKCNFDLNVEAFSEDLESAKDYTPSNPDNLFAPIYNPLQVPFFGIKPFNIEPDMDRRDSAATSAFCPASLLKAQDSQKKNSGSKSKENPIEINLNVAETVSDMAIEPVLIKTFPVSHCTPSNDSYEEISSRKQTRIEIDLNSTGNEEEPLLQSSHMSLSPTSSSSRYHSQRNFDLNDNLIYDSKSSSIIIMGKKMPVKRTDDTNQAYQNHPGSRLSSQHSSSWLPLKRKEPDSGWDS